MFGQVLFITIVAAAAFGEVTQVLNPEVSQTGWEIDQNIRFVKNAKLLSKQEDIYSLQPKVVSIKGHGLWVFPPNTYSKIQLDYQMPEANSANAWLRCYKFGPDKFMLRPLTNDGKLNCTIPTSPTVQLYQTIHQISIHELFAEAIFGPNSFAVCDIVAMILKDDEPQLPSTICTAQPI